MSLEKAISVAEEAINYDNLEMDYEAISKYKDAIEYLKIAHQDPLNAESYSVILDKVVEYSDRITYLSELHPGDPKFEELLKTPSQIKANEPKPSFPVVQPNPTPVVQQPKVETPVLPPKPQVVNEKPVEPVKPSFPPVQQPIEQPIINSTPVVVQPVAPPKVQEPVKVTVSNPVPQEKHENIVFEEHPVQNINFNTPPISVVNTQIVDNTPKQPQQPQQVFEEKPNDSFAAQPFINVAQPSTNTMQQPSMMSMQQPGMVPMQQPVLMPMGSVQQPGMMPMSTPMGGYVQVMTPQGPMLMPIQQPVMQQPQQPVFPQFGVNSTASSVGGAIAPIGSFPTQPQEVKPKVPKQSTTSSRTAFVRTKLSLEHPSTVNGLKAWKLAKPLAEKGKEFDNQTKYADALAYYEAALEYFAQALRAPELTDTMKKQLREDTKAYLARAEKIKPVVVEFLKQNPTYFGDVDNEEDQRLETCIACNKHIEGEFVSALGYNYHPQCFVSNVTCKLCGKPFTFPKMEFKIYNDQAYHPLCFEGVTGLEKEVTYDPTFQKGTIFYKVKLPKKIFNVNESFIYDVTIDNSTSCGINFIETGLVCEETRFSRGFSGDMKGETTKTEMAKKKISFEGGMMKNGVITKSEMFSLGMVKPSHHNDIMFYRGYKFVVSLKISGVALGPKEIVFPIYINE